MALMTAPIFFWRNSDLFKKKTFSSSKIDKIRAFLEISQNFTRKSLKSVTTIFEIVQIHNRGLKPTNKYIISHFSILLFMILCPLFLAQCAVRCCRQCGVEGGERVPPAPLGSYYLRCHTEILVDK